jgi:isovaleryl-CoA dehydrogenase
MFQVKPQAIEYNAKEKFSINLFHQLGDLGLLGLTVAEDYGGSGLVDLTSVELVHKELSYSDPTFCLSYLAHALLLLNNGNHQQKQKWLPNAITGTKIGGMGMSEPNAVIDVLGMATKVTKDEDHWLLNRQKMWITNGTLDEGKPTGDLFLIYARTDPGKTDITSFVLEKDLQGFTVGQQIHGKLGMQASPMAELVFQNVQVLSSNIIGKVNGATICMMRNLEIYCSTEYVLVDV